MEDCRCYEDPTFGGRTCGTLRRGYVVPCDQRSCDGGCPDDREPYGYGKVYGSRVFIWITMGLFAIVFLLMYLKMLAPGKV